MVLNAQKKFLNNWEQEKNNFKVAIPNAKEITKSEELDQITELYKAIPHRTAGEEVWLNNLQEKLGLRQQRDQHAEGLAI